MVSSIFNICSCFLYFTELTWLQNKIGKQSFTLLSRLILMHITGIHKVVRRFFHGVKCPGYRDLNKCQIPSHPGLNSCQMPGGCPGDGGGGGTLGFDSYISCARRASRSASRCPEEWKRGNIFPSVIRALKLALGTSLKTRFTISRWRIFHFRVCTVHSWPFQWQISLMVFLKQPTPYLDEVFHIPQAQEFCKTRVFTMGSEDYDPTRIVLLVPGHTRAFGRSFEAKSGCHLFAILAENHQCTVFTGECGRSSPVALEAFMSMTKAAVQKQRWDWTMLQSDWTHEGDIGGGGGLIIRVIVYRPFSRFQSQSKPDISTL